MSKKWECPFQSPRMVYGRKKSAYVRVYLSEDGYNFIKTLSKKHHISMSEVMRKLARAGNKYVGIGEIK